MADDIWKKYEENSIEAPPVMGGTGVYATPALTGADNKSNPWAKYEKGLWNYTYDGQKFNIDAPDKQSADIQFAQKIKEYETNKRNTEQAQNKKWDEQLQNGKTTWDKTDAALSGIFGRANRVMSNLPGVDLMGKKISPSLVKGIPIAGAYVPQTPELSEFEKNHPIVSKGLNIAGGTAATLPLTGAASMAMGGGFIPQVAGQMGVNIPLNMGDTLAKKGSDYGYGDAANDMLWGAGTSLIPPGVSSLVGQNARYASKPAQEGFRAFMSKGGQRLPGPPFSPSVNPSSAIPGSGIAQMSPETGHLLYTLGLAGLGAHFGGTEGAVAGFVGGPATTRLADMMKIGLQRPGTQDILRALNTQANKEGKDKVNLYDTLSEGLSQY